MVETTTHETVNMYPWLGNAMKFWHDKINETLLNFVKEKQWEKYPVNILQLRTMSRRLWVFYQQ